MALTKILFRAWGAVSVGASECVNATVQSDLGAVVVTGVAVDSKSTVWFTSTVDDVYGPTIQNPEDKVQMCPVDGDCVSVGSDWARPQGIVVDDSDGVTTVYISERGKEGTHPESASIGAGVRKCILHVGQTGAVLDCVQFEHWTSPSGLALDHEGNVLVTQRFGVWKCSPSADCALLGGTYLGGAGSDAEKDVAVDSRGNVYVTGTHESPTQGSPPIVFVWKCIPDLPCHEFGPTWHQAENREALGLAVGPDDHVYIRDAVSHNFIRCSPDGFCENIAFDGGFGKMAIDQHGIIYTVSSEACHDHKPGCSQLELRKFCFDLPTDIIQV